MESFLRERNPFKQSAEGLVSLSTGIIAGDAVDCDQALKKGEAIIKKLEGATLSDVTLKKSDQIKNLAQTCTITIEGETITIDPKVLFQRLFLIGTNQQLNPLEMFDYELCS